MSAITSTSTLPPPVAQRFNEKILATPQARLVHRVCATKHVMPDNSGTIMRFRRYNRLDTFPVPIDPSFSNVPSQQLSILDIDAKLDWYSTWVPITRQVTMVNEDPKTQRLAA